MDEDAVNKVETLIGFVEAAGQGKYPFGDRVLIACAEEAKEWIEQVKAERVAA